MAPSRLQFYDGDQQTDSAGCLSGFLLPPLAALCVGVLLVWLARSVSIPDETAALASGETLQAPPPNASQARLSPVFTPEVQFWTASLLSWAVAAGVDPNLAATVMQIESCGDPRARSSAGAMGLFQVMPWHFRPGEDAYDPDTNARRGLAYLRAGLDKSGNDARLALAGYNGGLGVIDRAEFNWPSQTQLYVYLGSQIYGDASSGAQTSAFVQERYGSQAVSMCRRARQRLGLGP